MASYTWTGANGGDWSDPANWSPTGVPGAADQALVNLAGTYAISLNVAEIGSLTLDAAGATITPIGTLKLDGALDVKAGTLVVDQTIEGGTLIPDGGIISFGGGTLDGVTLSGPLDLSAANASLTIADGISFTGSGPGQILDTGAGSTLSFSGTQTLDNVAISVNGAGLSAGSLTLDANSSLIATNNASLLYSNLDNKGTISVLRGNFSDFNAGTTFENEGTFSVNSSALTFISNLTNTGTVNVVASLASGNNVVNAGQIVVSQNGEFDTGGTFSNSGIITVDSTSTLEIGSSETLAQLGTIINNGKVLINGTLDLTGSTIDIDAGSQLYNGFQLFYGTVQGGTIETDGTGVHYSHMGTLSDVTIDGTLNVNGGPNSELDIENGLSFTGTTPGQIVETTTGSFLQFDGYSTLDNVDLTLGNSYFNVNGTSNGTFNGLTLGANSELTIVANEQFGSPASASPSTGTLDNKGILTIAASGSLSDFGGAIENEGLFSASGGSSLIVNLANTGTLSISGAASSTTIQMLQNAGTVEIANGGNLNVAALSEGAHYAGSFSSTGTVQISSHGTLTLQDGTNELGMVSFLDNTGTLVVSDLGANPYIDRNAGTTGTLNMFQSGDVLDLGPETYNIYLPFPGPYSLSHTGNTLTVDEGSSVFDTFTLTGQDYTNATFTLTGDIVTTDAPCFCAGTRILTDRGERAVEALEIGDVVVTRQDGVETLLPVRWIGCRRVVVAQHHEAEHVDPICIKRDAIAPRLPARDLFVSPDHALHLDGMLIQARQLVNYMTITRDSGRAVVTYYHVELDRHAILLADGMPCESYLDSGNRGHFDTAGTVVALHGATIDRVQHACAPVVTSGVLVRPIWQRLADRALEGGHVAPVPDLELDPSPWFETAGGERLVPGGDRLRVALPPGCRRVRLRSRSDFPTTLSPWCDDRRRLGVAISALAVHQDGRRREFALADLDAGWWPLETAGDLAWRWTDGDGSIDLPESAEAIEVTLHAVMPVPVDTPAPVLLAPLHARAR